jgi:hypothetical protein
MTEVLRVEGLQKLFPVRRGVLQRVTGHVRATARGLARQGRLTILRHGKPANPEQFKGVYRLRLPTDDERDLALAAAAATQVAPIEAENEVEAESSEA